MSTKELDDFKDLFINTDFIEELEIFKNFFKKSLFNILTHAVLFKAVEIYY